MLDVLSTMLDVLSTILLFRKPYLALGIIIIAAYGVIAFTGKEFGDPDRQTVPADVRQSPGGYRSFHVWYSGYRGGK